MMSDNVTVLSAFIAGLLSFLSPCVLPLIPSYITYITGLSFSDLQAEHPSHKIRQTTFLHALTFVAGFTVVFVLLGASATFIGNVIQEHMDTIRKVGGVLIILFGIHVTGMMPLRFLLGERRVNLHRKPAGFIGTFAVGLAFAAGWTPCIGPILASILMVAATEDTVSHGIVLLLAYSLGLGIPFLLCSLAMHQFLQLFNHFKRFIRVFEITTGVFLIMVGIMIYFNYLAVMGSFFTRLFGV
jgi:cytochrome c-type biogenesis protein